MALSGSKPNSFLRLFVEPPGVSTATNKGWWRGSEKRAAFLHLLSSCIPRKTVQVHIIFYPSPKPACQPGKWPNQEVSGSVIHPQPSPLDDTSGMKTTEAFETAWRKQQRSSFAEHNLSQILPLLPKGVLTSIFLLSDLYFPPQPQWKIPAVLTKKKC